nr:hypothetical protein BKA82DRAFT_2642110 [Pisolithus tinctorius]
MFMPNIVYFTPRYGTCHLFPTYPCHSVHFTHFVVRSFCSHPVSLLSRRCRARRCPSTCGTTCASTFVLNVSYFISLFPIALWHAPSLTAHIPSNVLARFGVHTHPAVEDKDVCIRVRSEWPPTLILCACPVIEHEGIRIRSAHQSVDDDVHTRFAC